MTYIRHAEREPTAAPASTRLHVTPSAISQRIKALEQRVGEVLVVREKPCTATPAGVPLLRFAAQTA
jgi:LysR family transcriptional regulator, chromosome initiation inhibitor